jgi:hypothetical protein
MADANIIVNVGLEPTEAAKQFIRQTVIDVLKELFVETPWLEERVNEVVDQTMTRATRQLILASPVERAL